ncbi:carnitine dehydratase, partial [Amycolatopsis mediterranei]
MRDVVEGVWNALTGASPEAFELTGTEDVLPGPYRVAAAATASVAAATLAAAEMLRQRDIEPGVVTADTRHAAAAFQSERLLRVDGVGAESAWAPLSGDYRTADGWVRLHCNYPRHEAAVCWGLGVPATREAVEKAVAGRPAREVEHAVVSAGG